MKDRMNRLVPTGGTMSSRPAGGSGEIYKQNENEREI